MVGHCLDRKADKDYDLWRFGDHFRLLSDFYLAGFVTTFTKYLV